MKFIQIDNNFYRISSIESFIVSNKRQVYITMNSGKTYNHVMKNGKQLQEFKEIVAKKYD